MSLKTSNKRKYRKTAKPKAWYDRKFSVKQIAKTAWNTAMYVKGLVNAEKKYFDVAFTPSTVDWGGSMVPLTQIAGGSGQGQREGNSVALKSIYAKLALTLNSSATTSRIRLMIFIDKQNTGSTPAVNDILSVTGSVNGVCSPLNVGKFTRYQVLYDKVYVLNNASNLTATMTKFINCNYHLKWMDSTSTNTYTNATYMLMISDVSTNLPTVNGIIRMGYFDN